MGLKHWMLPQDHFKTHLFFFNFWVGGPFSAWILVRRVCQTFKALQRGNLISVRGAISYRICFMPRRSFFVFFIFFRGGGQTLSGKFHFFFFFLNHSLTDNSKLENLEVISIKMHIMKHDKICHKSSSDVKAILGPCVGYQP